MDLLKREKRLLVVMFLTPGLLLYLLFMVFPLFRAIHMGFFQWRGFGSAKFVGLDNYQTLLRDAVFWKALRNNVFLMLGIGLLSTSLGMCCALIINKIRSKLGNALESVLFLPQLVSLVVLAMIWSFIYNPSFGLVNSVLRLAGLSKYARAWLGDSSTVLFCIAIAMIWYYIPFYIVLFTAGLRNIPAVYHEAAEIDGATGWHKLFYVTLPLLWEHVKVSVLYVIISLLGKGLFAPVHLMTGGGPDHASEIVVTYLYRQAFVIGQYGYATAIGVVMFVVLLLLIVFILRIMRREAVQY